MTPAEIEKLRLELSIRRFSRTGETELICSKAAEAITQLRADLTAANARVAALTIKETK